MTALAKVAVVFSIVILGMTTLTVVAAPPAAAAPGECPVGSFEDAAGLCRKPVADATACPEGAEGVPGGCYVVVDRSYSRHGRWGCPLGSFETASGECRKPVADVQVCPVDALGVPGGCYVFVPRGRSKTIGTTLRSFDWRDLGFLNGEGTGTYSATAG